MHSKIKLSVLILLAALILIPLGSNAASASAYLTTTVISINSAPVAENLEFDTYKDIPIEGTFSAIDPDGDEVTYSLTKDGKKGTVTIEGNMFTYTPNEGKKGKDSFMYVAIDSNGNISNEATVTINIKKRASTVTYSDMEGNSALYAATYLTEEGIFTGEQVGSEYLFFPDQQVTRGEFLAMCMELCDIDTAKGVTVTGFYDDANIPVWEKTYISSAVINNIISGSIDENGHIVFSADSPITYAQASVILNNALNITNVSVTEDDSCPVWASQAMANLSSCNVLTVSSDYSSDNYLTRADAAKILVNAVSILNNR